MTKKIYLYDSNGYNFYACEFEGLSVEGKPRLTIMTPGCPVENFSKHLDEVNEQLCSFYLLCEEGKTADSKMVIDMLGQMLLYVRHPLEKMLGRMEMMRTYGINYSHELQNVEVKLYEFEDEETKRKSYFLKLYVGDRFIGDNCVYEDLSDIVTDLSRFFFFIEKQVQIPLRKILEVKEDLRKKVMRHTTLLFDEVKTKK